VGIGQDQGTQKIDQDPNDPAIYNCRRDTTVTGYFKAYFEDVRINNGQGFDHPTLGAERRRVACQVLQDVGELIKLDESNTTPNILFFSNPNLPVNALAFASTFFFEEIYRPLDNGSLHWHII